MVTNNNPAGRLYTILREAESQNENVATLTVWANVFDLPETNELEIVRSILSLQELVEEVHRLVEGNPEFNSDLLLRSFPSLQRAVSVKNLANPWRTYKVGISDEAMTRLEFCSEILGKVTNEDEVSDEELENLKKAISDVIEYIENSSLPHELKTFISVQLENIRRGIFDYKIHGASGIRDVLAGVIGSMVTQSDLYVKIANEDEETIGKFNQLLDSIDKVTSTSLNVQKVISGVGKVLEQLPWLSS